ncbi:hypothetical protein CLOM_g16061 [Closterium sp. NIES-68]|nr:hypothetical protein CLOM_g16061 [Closterium sp. NIES-68]GJP63304.1 hypothetical protein CLOP_g20376 [Closterium sp. NIES-67]
MADHKRFAGSSYLIPGKRRRPRSSPTFRLSASVLLLVAAFAALSLHTSTAEDTAVPFNADQLAALDALKAEWGAFATSTTWTTTAQCLIYPKSPKVEVRAGLNCDADGNVIRLDLHGLGCTGSFPTSITKLTALTMLDLSFNKIAGPIPDFLSTLDKLVFLSLNYVPLTGSLPSVLSTMRSLNYLGVSNAQIVGPIPAAFKSFKSLETLVLSNNQMTGPLGSLPYMTRLRDAYLSNNAFSGALPPALGNVVSLRNIDLSVNKLSGGIPAAYSKLKNLDSFNISGNLITGSIPNVFTGRNIWALDLSANTLTGSLPKSIANLPGVQILNAHTNSLTGKLPTFKSRHLAGLNVANNFFYGPGKVTRLSAGSVCIANMPYGGKGEGNCFMPSSSCLEPQKVSVACSKFCGTNMVTGSGQCKNKGVCIGRPRPHCTCKYKWPLSAMFCRQLM